MRITRIEPMVIELKMRWHYGWHGLISPIGRYVILRIETDEGLVGLGEAPVLPDWGGEHGRYYGEDPVTAVHVLNEYLWPILEGADPLDIAPLLQRLDAPLRGHMSAKSAVDTALHDLAGKAMGVPVYKLLGGAMTRKIPVCHSVGLASPEEAAREVAGAVADGVMAMQVKVDGDPEGDCAVIAACRAAVGDGVALNPDINTGYSTVKEAIGVIQAMAEYGIGYIEQPVEGLERMVDVTAAVNVPVMTDEGAWTPHDALEVVRNKGADAITIYYSKSGGLQRAMHVGLIAATAGLPVNVNGALEMGVGNAANLHLAAALRGVVWPSVVPVTTLEGREQCKIGGVFYTDDIITEPFEYADGCLTVPDKPGLGVELDPKKIEKYRVA